MTSSPSNLTSSPSNLTSSPLTTTLPPLKKRRLSDPEQSRLQNNLVTSQNLLANNLYPLLRKQSSLSFTPLMFRQFPRIGEQVLAPQTSLFNSPDTSPFTSQIYQPSKRTSTGLGNESGIKREEQRSPQDKPVEVKGEIF